ncbi:MAG TPA: M20 family peptidase [Bacteroidales bacterium]|nr:M20 family peptidase [Bacteroidales bacterium]
MKKILLFLLASLCLLIAVVLFKAISFRSVQIEAGSADRYVPGDAANLHLSQALTFPTISYAVDQAVDTASFLGFHKFLSEAYPLVHKSLVKEVFSSFSLLYTWEGSNPDLKPVILTAHFDVVPAADTSSWAKKPFSGENDGTFIWGRGALDDKVSVISILEAVEKLLSENYRPERTIYLAFGHDEEISGTRGAGVIAAELKKRNVKAEFLLDEGYAVTLKMVPMIDKPVALIGTSEKGYLSVVLSAAMAGGHSAYPAKESAIIILNRALNKVIMNPMNPEISESIDDFIRYVGPEMPFYARIIFANKWLFRGLILKIYTDGVTSNALVRTTSAPTILKAGVKDNVIPVSAEAVVNFRILPGETTTDVLEHLSSVIADDRIKLTVMEGKREPAQVSPIDVPGFETINRTIRQVYPEALVAPTMMIAASDSRKYLDICRNIYNFAPIIVTSEDLARTHGLDERINIEHYSRGIGFYYQLIRNCNK